MKKLLFFFSFLISLRLFANVENSMSVEDIVKIAVSNNLEIIAKSKSVDEKKSRIGFESSLMDPVFAVEIMNIPAGPSDNTLMSEKKYSISQGLPFFGKRDLLKDKFELEYEIEKLSYQQRKLETAREIKIAFYDWWLAHQKRKYLIEQSKILEQLISVVRTEYITNKTPEAELLNLQIEHAKSMENIITIEAEIANRGVELERLTGGHFKAENSNPKDFDFKPWLEIDTDLNKVQSKLHFNYPAYLESVKAKELSTINYEISRKTYLPDFELMAEYIPREINSVYNFKIGISIPLWFNSKQSAAVEGAQIMQSNSEINRQFQSLNLVSELKNYIIDISEAQKRVKLYQNGLNIWTAQAISSSRASYLTRKVSFQTLIRSIEVKFQTQTSFAESVATLGKKVAALELCLSGINAKEITTDKKEVVQ